MSLMIGVNSKNDIFLDNQGNLTMVSGQEAVLQNCAEAAKAQLGEMVLNFDQGVANFQTVWRDAANISQFEAYVRAAISQVIGVVQITSFQASAQGNIVEYTATIETIYGRAVLNG